MKDNTVTTYFDENDEGWVRIKTGKFDFLLAKHDIVCEDITWYRAKRLAKEAGYSLPDKDMLHIISAYRDEINYQILRLYGACLFNAYWSDDSQRAIDAYVLFSNLGSVSPVTKQHLFRARCVVDLKNINK